MFYAVYDKASGRLVSSGTVLSAKVDPALEVKTFADPPPEGQAWDEVTLAFKPRPAKRILRKSDFIQRFTIGERKELFGFQFGNAYTTAQQKNLSAFMRYLDFLDRIDMDDTAISGGVQYLESVGVLAAGRASEILS